MSEEFAPTPANDEGWAIAEQWFMRFIGASTMIIAVISMIFGAFPVEGIAAGVVRGGNIVFTLLFGIASLVSIWWSSDIERIYSLIDGFKEKGNGRTYAAALMQFLFGALFALELGGDRFVLGLVGVLSLISCAFFLWRAQQIKRFS